MLLDGMVHSKKHFAELDDADVETFLRERKFNSEHLNLEFKGTFPPKGTKYDIREICKYIVGLSNEDGGLVVYGVSNSIRDPASTFPDYVAGLTCHPSLEDLSQWVKDRIHPLIASPAIRFFGVQGRKVAILKIPAGVNKPYCYYDPSSKAVSHFKKTAGGIAELTPDEIREFYRTHFIEQAERILRASELQGGVGTRRPGTREHRLDVHQKIIKPKLEDTQGFGFLGIYSLPMQAATIPVEQLNEFLTKHRLHFCEEMHYYPQLEPLQHGVSVGYFPRSIRQDIKSTFRVTLYTDGFVALDSQVNNLMDGGKILHLGWLSYELQRHLQLSSALLESVGVNGIRLIVELENIEDFSMYLDRFGGLGASVSPSYSGSHEPIERVVNLSEVHRYDGDKRNIVMPVVKDIMNEVSRIFGYSQAPRGLWDERDQLAYVKGLEKTR